MAKYRKKPVVIDAFQWNPGMADELYPEWALEAVMNHKIAVVWANKKQTMHIMTLEGTMTASPGDYIIRGVEGEFYPCKPDIFEKTYEKA